jgi:hypothetical protein
MTEIDLLILVIYFLWIASVLYQAFSSLEERVTIHFNREFLEQQLQTYEIGDRIAIKFKLKKSYQLNDLHDLKLEIQNQSDRQTLYLDWDASSLTDIEGRSQRIIRLIPSYSFEILHAQVSSAIAPTETFAEKFTAESALTRDAETQTLQPTRPWFDLVELKKDRKKRKIYEDFIEGKKTLTFAVHLTLRWVDPAMTLQNSRPYYLSCHFTINKLPWTVAIPIGKVKEERKKSKKA